MRFGIGRISVALATVTIVSVGCGGGGSTVVSGKPLAPTYLNPFGSRALGHLKITIVRPPQKHAQSTRRSPQFISTNAQALVFNVTALDPVEKLEFPNGVSVCQSTTQTSGLQSVSLAAPPGPDYFSIVQYSGTCGSGPGAPVGGTIVSQFTYSATSPTPLSQIAGDPAGLPTTNLPIEVVPGVENNLNELVWNAYTDRAATSNAPNVALSSNAQGTFQFANFTHVKAGPQAAAISAAAATYLSTVFDVGDSSNTPSSTNGFPTLMLSAVLAGVNVTAAIPYPVMELAPFTAAGNKILIPLTVTPFDNASNASNTPNVGDPLTIQGQGSAPIPLGTTITLKLSEVDPAAMAGNPAAPHTELYLVDSTNSQFTSQIVQSGNSITFDQVGYLDAAMIAAGPCGRKCAPGDPAAFYLVYDGSSQATFTSATVTPTFTAVPLAGVPPIEVSTGPVIPQQIIVSTKNLDPTVLPHLTSYTNPIGVATDGAGNLYVTDSTQVKSDYTNIASTSITGATFSGIAYDATTNNLYAVNHAAQTSANAIYSFTAPTLIGGAPVALGGAASGLTAPRGITYDPVVGNMLYVAAQNQIWQVALSGPLAGTATSIAGIPAGGSGDGTGSQAHFNFVGQATFTNFTGLAADTSLTSPTSGDIYIADYGNNAIRLLDPRTGIVTTVAELSGVTGVTFRASGATPSIIATSVAGIATFPVSTALQSPRTIYPGAASISGYGPTDGFVGPPPPIGVLSQPQDYYVQYALNNQGGWPGVISANLFPTGLPSFTPPADPALIQMHSSSADSMAASQSNALGLSNVFFSSFPGGGMFSEGAALTVSPAGVLYVDSPAGTFPGGTIIFTESGLLRGLL